MDRQNEAAAADANAVAERLRPVVMRLSRRLRREVEGLAVSSTQVHLLAAVANQPGLGLKELAMREGITAASLSTHVDRLERAGLMARQRGAQADRRRVGLRVTPAGEELLRSVRSRRTMWLAAGLERMSTADIRAIDAAVEPLKRLLDEHL